MGENQAKSGRTGKLTFSAIKKVKVVNPSPQYGRKYHPPLTSSTKATLLF
jgi:hypothetical protein